MDTSAPEWISVTITKEIQLTDAGPRMVQVKTGVVRMPDNGGVRIASQATGGGLYIIPPAEAAKVMGALREGLRIV